MNPAGTSSSGSSNLFVQVSSSLGDQQGGGNIFGGSASSNGSLFGNLSGGSMFGNIQSSVPNNEEENGNEDDDDDGPIEDIDQARP